MTDAPVKAAKFALRFALVTTSDVSNFVVCMYVCMLSNTTFIIPEHSLFCGGFFALTMLA